MSFEWMVSAGSVTGPAHLAQGTENQDRYDHEVNDAYALFIAADGAGSLARSGEGAQMVVDSISQTVAGFAEDADGEPLNDVAAIVRFALERAVIQIHQLDDYKQYGATVAVVLITPEGHWAAGTIGDAFAVIRHEDGSYEMVTAEPGEYANITELTTSENPTYNIISGAQMPAGVAASSDGLFRSTVAGGAPFAGFYDVAMRHGGINVEELFEYMSTQGKIDDDTTVVIGVKKKDE